MDASSDAWASLNEALSDVGASLADDAELGSGPNAAARTRNRWAETAHSGHYPELPAPLQALAARLDATLDEVEKARGLGAYEAMVAIRRVCVEAADVRDEVARIMAAAWRWS